jgi:hypothetical protein
MPGANVLNDELLGLIRREILKSQGSFQPRPVRGRRQRRGRPGEGGGTGLGAAWIVNNVQVPAGTGDAASRVPGTFTGYVVLEGEIATGLTIKNYSTLAIPAETVLGVKEIIDGSWSIWPAVC